MALPLISGLRSTCPGLVETGSDVVVAMATPSADAIPVNLRSEK
jgi:hypothetical protein